MNQPVIADKKPALMVLEAGTYYWCSCGKSNNKSFCDGSHKDSEFTPVAFKMTEKRMLLYVIVNLQAIHLIGMVLIASFN